MTKGDVIKSSIFDTTITLSLVQTVFGRFMWYLEKEKQVVENSSVYSDFNVAVKAYEMKKLELSMKGYTQNAESSKTVQL